MESIIAGVIVAGIFGGVLTAVLVNWIQEHPEDYKKAIKALADLISFPMLLYVNIRHNIAAHKRQLKKISKLSNYSDLDREIKILVEEAANARRVTQTIENLRTPDLTYQESGVKSPIIPQRQSQ